MVRFNTFTLSCSKCSYHKRYALHPYIHYTVITQQYLGVPIESQFKGVRLPPPPPEYLPSINKKDLGLSFFQFNKTLGTILGTKGIKISLKRNKCSQK